jgi:hypothetical protein
MFLVGITAIGFAHGKALNTGEIRVPTKWFPGYALNAASSAERPEVKSFWRAPDGSTYIGTRLGLFRTRPGGEIDSVRGLANIDIKALAVAGPTGPLIAATREGVYRVDGGQATTLLAGDVHGVAVHGGALVATHRKRGVLRSDDMGARWIPEPGVADAAKRIPLPPPAETVTLSRLIFDIHTGSAFVGATYDWIWWDVLGGILAFLVATGVYLWWAARRRLARERAAALPVRPRGAPVPTPVAPPGVLPGFAAVGSPSLDRATR